MESRTGHANTMVLPQKKRGQFIILTDNLQGMYCSPFI